MAQADEMFAPAEQQAIDVQPPSAQELRLMFKAFGDAKDRWKIDGATMKGYYLHSESGYLYIWHQATGVLYEHLQTSGQCQAVWSSAAPQLNAEIWTVLPLPPTDPASMQASSVANGELPNIDVFVNLTIAHEADKQIPTDLLQAAVEEFTSRWELRPQAARRITKLPPAGQCFALQNFRGDPRGELTNSEALESYVEMLRRLESPPWGNSACTLRVESTGAIIGRCCPDLDALCREDPPERLAQAHCKIRSEKDRFFLCDMETTDEGTMLDGYAVNSDWVGPLKSGSLITCGPLRIKIQLSEMAKAMIRTCQTSCSECLDNVSLETQTTHIIEDRPCWVTDVTPALLCCDGGLVVEGDSGAVLNSEGSTIRGLFAAGEAVANRGSASPFLSCVASALRAAEAASKASLGK
eukprot:s12_g5.t1